MIKIRVWHGVRHEDNDVTDMEYDGDFTEYLKELHRAGGFRVGDKFVPWHRINFVEAI